ncbi:uncharacterized protein SCHCODRAFT_02683889 [Schizophyllum commune H4-8]|uniref:Uncharacterized protein n=1 Tax=Schizophyllum commune (strain H4-8 / FGSC 9210) TaxID=578458 RepID=D8PKS8_SCHCM|nr:uncharacterized protein SCHCODRAFT_02683889 [Schizophyllum commune H4-8]KAI5897574.1 hypothetical protein SCHCODRAFT_02683889 [Schizophyllum commune H4-8]
MNPVLLGFAKLYNLVPGMGSIIEYLAPAAEPTLVPGQCEKESAEPHPAQYKRALDDGAGQATSNDIPKSPILDHRPAPTIVHDRQHILTPPPAIEPFTNVYHCAACTKEASERRACVCGHANPLAERLIASQREIEDLFSQLKERHIWIDKLQVQLRSAQWQNEDQLHLIANLDRTLHDTQVMLYEQQEHSRRENDLQRQELEIARRFLQRSDTLSEADVKGQVMKLNEEVFQIATSLVDEILDGGGSDIGDSTSVDGPDALTIERLVGSPVVRALEESRIGEEGANVARQWRAMTRRSLRVAEQEKRELCAQFAGSVCRDLVTLLGFCQQLGIRGDRIDFEPYRERLAYVAELAIELNESVGFGVSSVDLTVFTVQMGQNFDRPSMRDFWSDPVESTSACDQPKEDTVVGTCALGLKREGSSGDGEKAASVGLVLLPASIVLQSALHPDPHA